MQEAAETEHTSTQQLGFCWAPPWAPPGLLGCCWAVQCRSARGDEQALGVGRQEGREGWQ